MKKQTLNKKLSLSKSTVANLEQAQMDDMKGGTFPTVTCHIPSFCKPTCTDELSYCIGC